MLGERRETKGSPLGWAREREREREAPSWLILSALGVTSPGRPFRWSSKFSLENSKPLVWQPFLNPPLVCLLLLLFCVNEIILKGQRAAVVVVVVLFLRFLQTQNAQIQFMQIRAVQLFRAPLSFLWRPTEQPAERASERRSRSAQHRVTPVCEPPLRILLIDGGELLLLLQQFCCKPLAKAKRAP